MKRFAFCLTAFALAALLGVAAPGRPAQAAPLSFTVALSGAQQVPPVQTAGTGTADLTYDPATQVVTWSITYSGLSSPATMAHFHGPAGPGKNAAVLIWLTKKGAAVASPITGKATLTAAQAKQFAAGEWYINIHTKDHPAGEIRGQVVPPKS
jgi:hypothetical protein